MGNFLILTGDAGVNEIPIGGIVEITSPNYPSNYPNNAYEEWELVAPSGFVVRLHFTDFYMESCCDQLTINDGLTSTRLSGSSLPNDYFSRGTYLELVFSSDYSVTYSGFRLEATAFNTSSK